MATIKKYTKSNGEAAYMFNMYVGIDPLTGKKQRTTRRGFKTQNVPSEWMQMIYRHLKKNGHDNFKRITVHGFRHTHCSLLFETGVSIKEVQVRLGHSDIKTTLNIYTHLTQEVKAETANTFANFMKNESRGIQKGSSH